MMENSRYHPKNVDLCTCGPMTRAEGYCDCEPKVAASGNRWGEGGLTHDDWLATGQGLFGMYSETYQPAPSMHVETVTEEGERLTQEARHHSYGPPHLDFAKVTGMSMALWGRGPQSPIEHAMYMILVKLSRLQNSYDRDSVVDICGYARNIEMIVDAEGKDGEESSGQ